jgi:hypothetical protein
MVIRTKAGEAHGEGQVVLRSSQIEVFVKTRYLRIAYIAPVQESNDIEKSQHGYQANVDLA